MGTKLNFHKTIFNTIKWYNSFQNNPKITNQQIVEYFNENNFIRFYENYVFKLNSYLTNIDNEELIRLEKYFKKSINKNNKIFLAGNGGSAATAALWPMTLVLTYIKKYKKINFQSLVDNTSIVTAISNDTGYSNLFLNQLKLIIEKGMLYLSYLHQATLKT